MKAEGTDISTLFRQHYRELCLYALHYVGGVEEAEDIVMDCFLKFHGRQGRGEHFASPKSYLYMMVRNACIDHVRRNGAAIVTSDLPDIPDDNIDEAMTRSEQEARLWAAIDSLPKACRNVLLLSKRDGLKNKEIAERLCISIKTVEAHLTKAFKALSKLKR